MAFCIAREVNVHPLTGADCQTTRSWPMSRLLKVLGTAMFAAACLLLGAAATAQRALCNEGRPVKLAGLNWESAHFTTHIIGKLLDIGYGCTTEIVQGTSAALESTLVQNDLQLIAEIWSGRSAIIQEGLRQGDIQIDRKSTRLNSSH